MKYRKTFLKNRKKIDTLIKSILIGISLFLVGCEDTLQDSPPIIQYDMRLPIDGNGYYHLTMDRSNWQTLHRVSGSTYTNEGNPIEFFWVEWESDLYWYLGDTLGYIVNQHLTACKIRRNVHFFKKIVKSGFKLDGPM